MLLGASQAVGTYCVGGAARDFGDQDYSRNRGRHGLCAIDNVNCGVVRHPHIQRPRRPSQPVRCPSACSRFAQASPPNRISRRLRLGFCDSLSTVSDCEVSSGWNVNRAFGIILIGRCRSSSFRGCVPKDCTDPILKRIGPNSSIRILKSNTLDNGCGISHCHLQPRPVHTKIEIHPEQESK